MHSSAHDTAYICRFDKVAIDNRDTANTKMRKLGESDGTSSTQANDPDVRSAQRALAGFAKREALP